MDVPAELATLRQWIVWRDENGRKIPYQINGAHAKSNDPATWSTLEEARNATAGYSGLGFVFADDDGLLGIDLDGCRNPESGELAEWAECLVNELATYTEVSPSGTGVKLWAKGKLSRSRKFQVDEEQISTKRPGVEAYDKGRYFTFTGQRIGNWEIRLVDVEPILARMEPPPTPIHFGQTNDSRASAYIASIPGAAEGSRNHAAFRVAAVLANDFALPDDQALPLLQSWNARNTPPLGDKELQTCLKSAGRNAKKPHGAKLTETPAVDPIGDSAAASILKSANGHHVEPASESLPIDHGEFPEECLTVPGLIGDVIDHNLRTAMYPQPQLSLAGALALMAVITGRKITDESRTRTNVYILGIAPSGGGKEHARTINKEILINASSEGEKMLGPERIGSSAGLVSSVHAQPAILFHIDEFGKMLATMKNAAKSPHLYNIGSVLMQLYSSANSVWIADAYADLKKTKRIIQPHACVYGTGTPDDFWGSLTKENVEDGLLGRLLTFEGKYVKRQTPQSLEVPGIILERVRKWLEMRPEGEGNLAGAANPKPLVVPSTDDAKDRLAEHLDGICDRRKNELGSAAAVWSRSGEKTAKLALLFACSRWVGESGTTPVVEFSDVDRAVKITNWLTRKMLRMAFDHVAENDTESKSKKLLRVIVGEITMSELTRRTQWVRGRERSEIINDLVACGYVSLEQKDTNGRPVTYLKRTPLK